MPRRIPEHDRCTDSSRALVTAYRAALAQEDSDCSLAVVSSRGGPTEFALGRAYAASADPLDRVTGTDVLAQLGWEKRAFLRESVEILVRLLADSDERVIAAAACGLGHRNDPAAIPPAFNLISHPNPHVRLGAVMALSQHDNETAIAGLIRLSQDENADVRNWAAFGLGSQTDLDLPSLRDALVALLSDPDPEIRGEAMIGLARRKDPRAYAAIVCELDSEFHGSWCLEAAALLTDPRLLPHLLALRERTPEDDLQQFAGDFEEAVKACTPGENIPTQGSMLP